MRMDLFWQFSSVGKNQQCRELLARSSLLVEFASEATFAELFLQLSGGCVGEVDDS